uniref:Uncharacterized protein n=1 Tax=Meloidogyne enterolobii TaxID=390850 RepID=A0A6V7VZK2_MELEN|nr:unnamed protein product [Meloidogyne enterolobii]
MKIYNLILLNFCFLQHFPLVFGMNPGTSGSQPGGMYLGESSGSQQPFSQLDPEIRQLLEKFGNSEPNPRIRRRQLKNQENMQVIDTIAKQYDNLLSANNELNNEFMNSCTRVQNNPMVKLLYIV